MGTSSVRALTTWLAVPFRRSSRSGFAWYLESGAAESAGATGALPETTWSQDGEDLLFAETFSDDGFFVDVGAHHPDRFSVTRKLYDRGWSGVNIDFSPGFLENFSRRRPRDINIEALVGRPRDAVFWRFEEAALSTLDGTRAERLQRDGWTLAGKSQTSVRSLTDLLESNGVDRRIDLLSVDVEGADLEVLSSLDWSRWDVQRCLAELSTPAYAVATHPIARFLASHGLLPTRVWGRSCLFERVEGAELTD